MAAGCLDPAYLDASGHGGTSGITSATDVTSANSDAGEDPGSSTSTGHGDGSESSGTDGPPEDPEPTTPQPASLCPEVEPPPGATILMVGPTDATELPKLLQDAASGSAILLEPGIYRPTEPLVIRTPGIYLGASTHSASDVELSGGIELDTLIRIEASGVTLSNLSFTATLSSAVEISGGPTANTSNVRLANLIFRDVRGGVAVRPSPEGYYSDDGLFACSTVDVTDVARQALASQCDIRGFGAFGVVGWTVRDSLFRGLWCNAGDTAYAIAFAGASRDVRIERNRIVQCSRGIRLGRNDAANRRPNPDPRCGGDDVDVLGAVVSNNMLAATEPDLHASQAGLVDAVSVVRGCDVEVAHNSAVSSQAPRRAMIELRGSSEDITLYNNLNSHPIVQDEQSSATAAGNDENASLDIFIDAQSGDLHLDPNVADPRGVSEALARIGADIDADTRADPPNIGADERPP